MHQPGLRDWRPFAITLKMKQSHQIVVTSAGIRLGILSILALIPGVVAFGLSFGAVAAKAGLSLFDTAMMSAIVFAGAAQFVAISAWQNEWTWAGAVTVCLLVGIVNSRLILMGASLRSHLRGVPPLQAYGLLALNTDASWLMMMSLEGKTTKGDVGAFLGAGLALWIVWLSATIPGWWLGALVGDPKRFGLDLVMIVFFSCMLIPMWKGQRKARPWAVALGVALFCQALIPGPIYILLGSLSGAIAGAFLDE